MKEKERGKRGNREKRHERNVSGRYEGERDKERNEGKRKRVK